MKPTLAQSNHHRWWKRTIIIGVKSDELGLRGQNSHYPVIAKKRLKELLWRRFNPAVFE
jgi:hypothetical protein